MPKNKNESCCEGRGGVSDFRVEAIISVDERGQMVLPKDLREKYGIAPGDKLVVTALEKEGKVCCFALLKVHDFAAMVKEKLGPALKEIL